MILPKRHLFMAFANPVPGQEATFNTWYDQHVKDLLRIQGFAAAQRYEAHPAETVAPAKHKYMVIYELEGDPKEVLKRHRSEPRNGRLPPDPAFVQMPISTFLYSPLPGSD